MKYVKLMADYTSSGVWDKDGCCISIDSLPISDTLKEKIDKWQAEFDLSDDYMDEPQNPLSTKSFSNTGFELAMALKHQLKNEYEVWYYNYDILENCTGLDHFYEIGNY